MFKKRAQRPIQYLRKVEEENSAIVTADLIQYLNTQLRLTGAFHMAIRPMLEAFEVIRRYPVAIPGMVLKTAIWIYSGYARLYKIDTSKGYSEVKVLDFCGPKRILVAQECFFKGEECTYFIEIAKGSIIVPFTRESFDQVKEADPQAEALATIILSSEKPDSLKKVEMLTLNTSQKYELLLEIFGEGITQYFPQKCFASYFGVSTVNLSKVITKINKTRVDL